MRVSRFPFAATLVTAVLLSFAPAAFGSAFELPDGTLSPWARSAVDPPAGIPAPSTLAPVGIVDDAVDPSVKELAKHTRVINHAKPGAEHGTEVASVIAAPINGVGVAGVAPGAKIYSFGVVDFDCGQIARGVRQLVRAGVKVINLSIEVDGSCPYLWNAIAYADAKKVTVVAAAGNSGESGNPRFFPASYPHVITVGAVEQPWAASQTDLQWTGFSEFNRFVDLVAPGVDVPVDVPLKWDKVEPEDDPTPVPDSRKDGVTSVNGTSVAAPFVTGAISWLLGKHPELDPSQVAAILRDSARDLGTPNWDPFTGYGIVQVNNALHMPVPKPDFQEPNDTPELVRPAGSGTFGKAALWSGGAAHTIHATGDSADDPVDGYRVTVPARRSAAVSLTPSAGQVNLFAFRAGVTSFGSKPLAASVKPALGTDTVVLRNRTRHRQTMLVVANSVADPGTRAISAYSLTVSGA